MHVEASLSGTQTAACSVAGILLAVRGRGVVEGGAEGQEGEERVAGKGQLRSERE